MVKLAVDRKALAEEEILDGCYVHEADLPEAPRTRRPSTPATSLYHVEGVPELGHAGLRRYVRKKRQRAGGTCSW